MKNKGLLILSGLVLLVGGYAIYDYQSEKKSEQQKDQQSLILDLKADQISEIKFQTEKEQFSLLRKTEGWMIQEPISEKADESAVNNFVEELSKEKSITMITSSGSNESLDLKVFGLDKPKASIELKDNSGKSVRFTIGSVKNFEGQCYLQKNQDNKVILSSSDWHLKSEKKVFDFRDKRLLRMDISSVKSIHIFGPAKTNENIMIVKKDADWVLSEKQAIKLDQNKVREILTIISATDIKDFMSSGTPSKEQSKILSLANPVLQFELEANDGKKWKAKFFKSKENIITAKLTEPDYLVKLSPSDLDKLQQITISSIRDRQEAFNFNKSDIKDVLVNLKKVTSEKSKNLIGQLRNMEVLEFADHESTLLPMPEAKGQPKTEVQLIGEQDKKIWSLEIGIKKTIPVNGVQTTAYLAKSSSYANFFWIKENDVKELIKESEAPK